MKCICTFNRVLSCLRLMGASRVIGQAGAPVGGCGYWQVTQLHQTGPGEVPMTCFIPTLALCRKTRGKSSHYSSICLKRMEKVLQWQDRASVVCCCVRWECRKTGYFAFTQVLDWLTGSGKILLIAQRTENHISLSVFWTETVSSHWCLNAVIGR